MATLSSALNYAVAGLSIASAQSSLAARNIAGASDPYYSRRTAEVITMPGGVPSAAVLVRSADKRLLDMLQAATGAAAGQHTTLTALNELGSVFGDPQSDTSLTAMLAGLQTKVRDAESDPSSMLLATGLVQHASDLAASLNAASAKVQSIRQQADHNIEAATARIAALLDQFKVANDAVVRGSGTPAELADSLDQRDRILKQLSEDIGIRTVTRANNDVAIYTDGGITLFETVPRTISFMPTPVLTAGTAGQQVRIDGVVFASTSGRLAADLKVRDTLAPVVQTQLDEIARGLVSLFAESGDGSLEPAAGLFVNGGSTSVPPDGVVEPGLAARLRINAAATGNPMLVRDGGFAGAGYVENPDGSSVFQLRLARLQAAFDTGRAFSPDAGLDVSVSIKAFTGQAAGSVERSRQRASAQAESAAARQARADEALLRVTGVSIDEEMAAILDLEKSYQASAKVMAAVDAMLAALLEAVR